MLDMCSVTSLVKSFSIWPSLRLKFGGARILCAACLGKEKCRVPVPPQTCGLFLGRLCACGGVTQNLLIWELFLNRARLSGSFFFLPSSGSSSALVHSVFVQRLQQEQCLCSCLLFLHRSFQEEDLRARARPAASACRRGGRGGETASAKYRKGSAVETRDRPGWGLSRES